MPSVFIVLWLAVAGWVAVWLVARRRTAASEPGRVRTALRWLAGVATVALGLILVTWTVTFVCQVVRVEGQAMAPTIEHQDFVLVNKMAYLSAEPRRGDVVMLLYPVNPDKKFVKRIIGEQADTVRITDGRVYVNDLRLDDNYVRPEYRSHEDWGPQVIQEGYCFVMGDRRNNSSDSRHWGMVPIKYVLGRVVYRLSGARSFTAVR